MISNVNSFYVFSAIIILRLGVFCATHYMCKGTWSDNSEHRRDEWLWITLAACKVVLSVKVFQDTVSIGHIQKQLCISEHGKKPLKPVFTLISIFFIIPSKTWCA